MKFPYIAYHKASVWIFAKATTVSIIIVHVECPLYFYINNNCCNDFIDHISMTLSTLKKKLMVLLSFWYLYVLYIML